MTVILTFIGVLVFLISWPTTKNFSTSLKRLVAFTITGVIIDALIVGTSVLVAVAISI